MLDIPSLLLRPGYKDLFLACMGFLEMCSSLLCLWVTCCFSQHQDSSQEPGTANQYGVQSVCLPALRPRLGPCAQLESRVSSSQEDGRSH